MSPSLKRIEKVLLGLEEPSISKEDMEKVGVFTLDSEKMLDLFGNLGD